MSGRAARGPVAGAVLCGGASSRMGRDKALVPWEGVPMARRVADALAGAGCDPVFAVGGDATALAALGLATVPDAAPGEGPLGGVITALRHAAGLPVMVVACDLPLLTPRTVADVLAVLGDGAEVALAVTDRWEPLCAAWSPTTLGPLESAFAAGERDLHGRIAALPHREVAILRQDLRNVNTPSDLGQ